MSLVAQKLLLPDATMNTVIVSRNSSDPIAVQLRGLAQSFVEGSKPSSLSYVGFEKSGMQEQVDLAMLVLSADVENGLELLRRMRPAVHGHLLAVGHAGDPK